jgi:hypothetical protein
MVEKASIVSQPRRELLNAQPQMIAPRACDPRGQASARVDRA